MLRRVTEQAFTDVGVLQLVLYYGNDLIRTVCALLNLSVGTTYAATSYFNRYSERTLKANFRETLTNTPSWYRRVLVEKERELLENMAKRIYSEREDILSKHAHTDGLDALAPAFSSFAEKWLPEIATEVLNIKKESSNFFSSLPQTALAPPAAPTSAPSKPPSPVLWSALKPTHEILSLWDILREIPSERNSSAPLRTQFNILPVAAACVLLATKATVWRLPEGSNILACIATAFERVDRRRKGMRSRELGGSHGAVKIIKEAMLLFEKDILEVLSYETSFESPHKYAINALTLLFEAAGPDNAAEYRMITKDVVRVCNDTCCSLVFTTMPPMVVACVAIQLACNRIVDPSPQSAYLINGSSSSILPKDWHLLFDVKDSQLAEGLMEMRQMHTAMESIAFRTLSRVTPMTGPGRYIPPTHSAPVAEDADTAGGTATFCSLLTTEME